MSAASQIREGCKGFGGRSVMKIHRMRRFDEDPGWSNESLKSNKSFETIGLLGIGAAKSSRCPAACYHACAKLKPELPVFLHEMAIQFFSVWPLRCNRYQGYSLRESLPSQRGA